MPMVNTLRASSTKPQMVKHTETVRRLLLTNRLSLTILWGWHLKG